jgi:hypothetical protein
MRDDLTGFGPIETQAQKWRQAFFGLLILLLLVILSHWVHDNNAPAIPSQGWSFGEPSE